MTQRRRIWLFEYRYGSMIRKIIYVLVLFIVIAITVGFVLINNNQTTIYLGPEWPVSGISGVLLLCAFGLGIIFSSFISIFFGIRAFFREQKLKRLDKKNRQFYELMLDARVKSLSLDYLHAIEHWENLIEKDPTDIIARVELAKVLDCTGKTVEALKILDTARSQNPNSLEVLFEAARMQTKLDNKTAAIDNLALSIGIQPTAYALRRARDLSIQLNRYEDAREYNELLASHSRDSDDISRASGAIDFALLAKDIKNLRAFSKKFPLNTEARVLLSSLLHTEAQYDEALNELMQVYRITKDSTYARQLIDMMIDLQQRDKAKSFAASIRNNATGIARIESELEYIRTLARLHQDTEAKVALEALPELMKTEKVPSSPLLLAQTLLLKAIVTQRISDPRDGVRLLKDIEGSYLIGNAS